MIKKKAEARKVRGFIGKLIILFAVIISISVGYMVIKNEGDEINTTQENIDYLFDETIAKINTNMKAIDRELQAYEYQGDQLNAKEQDAKLELMKLKSDLIIERQRLRNNESTVRAIRIEVDRVVNAFRDVRDMEPRA